MASAANGAVGSGHLRSSPGPARRSRRCGPGARRPTATAHSVSARVPSASWARHQRRDGGDVVVHRQQPAEMRDVPPRALGRGELAPRRCGDVIGQPEAGLVDAALLVEPAHRERPHGLEQPEARSSRRRPRRRRATSRPRAATPRRRRRRFEPDVSRRAATASSAVNGPAQQAEPVEQGRRRRSGSSRYDHSIVAARLRCRGSPRKRGRASTSTPSPRRARISAGSIVRVRAAASSIASGTPSRWRHKATTAASCSSAIDAPASRARSRNSRTESLSSVGSVGVRHSERAENDEGLGREVERGAARGEHGGDWQAPRRSAMASAAAAVTCSQLSTTKSAGRSDGEASRCLEGTETELTGDRTRHRVRRVDTGQVDARGRPSS